MTDNEFIDFLYGMHPFDDEGMYKEEYETEDIIPKKTGLDKINVTKGE